jgi:hypothetical protein
MSPVESRAIEEYLSKELKDGKIRRSNSPVAAPCFFVKKVDGSLRLVVDYRKINEITIPNCFPMPSQIDLIEKLKGAKIFSKMDIRWGFNNIQIKEGDEWKTAFRTSRGQYENLVMPFGLMNAPAVFQEFMNAIFRDVIDEWVVIYMDEILVFSNSKEEYSGHVREVLSRLRKRHLFLKPRKCDFFTTSTSFIGISITPEGISIEKEKIRALAEWPTPTTVKQLRSFLDFANFLRSWVNNFSSLAKPLTTLTRKDVKWGWSEEEDKAFNSIKKVITSAPDLIHPNPEEPYYLETDASGVALGAILSQKGQDGRMHPIAFLSESFTPPQRNYDTHDKELLAIIRSLEHWRLYMEGTLIPIIVYTDHRNLQSWSASQVWNKRHTRWHITLSSFNYEIHYRPGKMSTKPDALS